MSPKSKYSLALSKFNIGPIELPNRIVFPAWQLNYANRDGTVSEKLSDFYLELAQGGCGLIFTGAAVVSPESVAFDRVMRIDQDAHLPALEKLFKKIEAAGSVPGIQLIHYGRQALSSVTGHDLLAPSPIPCPVMSKFDPNYRLREMTLEDIGRVRNDFIEAGIRSASAGAKVIEVHAAHGYLLNQFLSPYSNHRTDAYGGTPANRARLILEIIEGITSRLDSETAISVRISGDEFVQGGLTPKDFSSIIPLFQQAGMDLLNVSAGVYESIERIVPPPSLGITPHINIATALKEFTQIPVCAVGSVFSLETAETIISSGKADLVAMGRAQVADPQIISKSKIGSEDTVNKCIQCNNCTFWSTGDPEVRCTVNPRITA